MKSADMLQSFSYVCRMFHFGSSRLFFGFGCGLVGFVCLVAFVFGLWFVLDGTAHWTVYRSITNAFVAIDK